MEIKIKDMCDWERKKAIFLMKTAEDLGISTNDYGEVALNTSSGYVYLWSENFNFSLYMPINCELVKTDISVLWSCPECGQEEEFSLNDSSILKDIENEINELEQKHNKENH